MANAQSRYWQIKTSTWQVVDQATITAVAVFNFKHSSSSANGMTIYPEGSIKWADGTITTTSAIGSGGGIIPHSHSIHTGLQSDDHTQYVSTGTSRGSQTIDSSVTVNNVFNVGGGNLSSFSGLAEFQTGLETNALNPYSGDTIDIAGTVLELKNNSGGNRDFATSFSGLDKPAFATYELTDANYKNYYGIGQVSGGLGLLANDTNGTAGNIQFFTGNLDYFGGADRGSVSEKMRINSLGCVGINELTPDARFEVSADKSDAYTMFVSSADGSTTQLYVNAKTGRMWSQVDEPVNNSDIASKYYVDSSTNSLFRLNNDADLQAIGVVTTDRFFMLDANNDIRIK